MNMNLANLEYIMNNNATMSWYEYHYEYSPPRLSPPLFPIGGRIRQNSGGMDNNGTMTIRGATIANNSAIVRRALDPPPPHARRVARV